MKTKKGPGLNNIFPYLITAIFIFILIIPLQAQEKRDHRTKEKTKTRDHRNKGSNDPKTTNISYSALDHFWSSTRTDNYATANSQGKIGALKTKYRLVRTDGYIQKENSNIEGQAVPLYLYYSDARKDNFTTATTEGIRAAEAGGYRKVRVEGYVLKTVKPEYQHLYKPLWLYYHDTRKDNFTIATPEGIRTAEAGGYRKVRIEGYVSITNRNSAPENDVAINDSRNDFLVTNPPRSTQEDIDKWNRIVTKMQGIEGFDPVGNIIGEYPAEKTQGSEVVLHFFNNWVPIDSKKHACCGKLKKFKIYDGGNDEMDWGFYITPNDAFSFLIKDVLQYKDPDGYDAAWDGEFSLAGFHMGENAPGGWHVDEKFRDHRPGYEWSKYLLEGEITPDESLYDNVFFPRRGKEVIHASGDISYTPNLGSLGREICIYGPWVRERVHNNRPEIHPSEMIWWRENKGYYLMFLQDDSNRFDDQGDFDFGVLGGFTPDNWKAWAEPPLTAQFKIAFEVMPRASKLPIKMDIREIYKRFVVTKDDADASKDSDTGTSHTLVVNNKKLLVVNEQQENDNDLGVRFVDITERADGTIQGYLQITTKVGGPDLAGDEGYHVIYVSSSKMPIVRTVRDHRTD